MHNITGKYGACLLISEDANSIKWMIEVFKKLNEKWESIRVVMADKDIAERNIIKEYLPNASVLICLFHVFRTEELQAWNYSRSKACALEL